MSQHFGYKKIQNDFIVKLRIEENNNEGRSSKEGFSSCIVCGGSHATIDHKCGFCLSSSHCGKNCPQRKDLCRYCHNKRHKHVCPQQNEYEAERQANKCKNDNCDTFNRCSECRCAICNSSAHKTTDHNCTICRRYNVKHIEKDCKEALDDITCPICCEERLKIYSSFDCKHVVCGKCLLNYYKSSNKFICPICRATAR